MLPLERQVTLNILCVSALGTQVTSRIMDFLIALVFLYSIVPVIVTILKQVRRQCNAEYTPWLILHVQSNAVQCYEVKLGQLILSFCFSKSFRAVVHSASDCFYYEKC